jgi:hypothetical protein
MVCQHIQADREIATYPTDDTAPRKREPYVFVMSVSGPSLGEVGSGGIVEGICPRPG